MSHVSSVGGHKPRQPLLATDTRVGHTCVADQITPAWPHSWLHWMQIHCIKLSVYNIYCTQYYNCIIKLCYITWERHQCSYISYVYGSSISKDFILYVLIESYINSVLTLYTLSVVVVHINRWELTQRVVLLNCVRVVTLLESKHLKQLTLMGVIIENMAKWNTIVQQLGWFS